MLDNSQERISLGHITGVSGLKGWIKVHSDTNPRDNIVSYPSWWLEQSGQWRQVVVLEGRPQGKTIVARIEGIATPEQASTLIGANIAVDRDAMPVLDEGEFYWADLVGMQVHTVEGVHIGTACRLFETGANDVLVVTDERQLCSEESAVAPDELADRQEDWQGQGDRNRSTGAMAGARCGQGCQHARQNDNGRLGPGLLDVHIGVVSLFPELIEEALQYGVIGRAKRNGLLRLAIENPREFAQDSHRTVDDRPFGGGPGMVMKPGPLIEAIDAARRRVGGASKVVYLSPQGQVFDQSMARAWQHVGSLVLVSGRYEGVDERVISRVVDQEVSLGDFVLSGGEFAALAIIDAVTRLVPGVLGDPLSSEEDSFGTDGLLDCPHYTRPDDFEGQKVPPVLLSGDHKAIARWRRQQALAKTWQCRPELLETAGLTKEDIVFLTSLKAEATLKGS